MKLRMIFRLVPIVIMTITQTESWYVERLQIARLQECKKEIRTSLDYVERPQDSQHTAKPFYIASDTHEESVLAGKFQFALRIDKTRLNLLLYHLNNVKIHNSILYFHKVSCGGFVFAKHKTGGCNSNNIITKWDASCGNVAFMPCENDAIVGQLGNGAVGTSFEICVAGFRNYALVYDEDFG